MLLLVSISTPGVLVPLQAWRGLEGAAALAALVGRAGSWDRASGSFSSMGISGGVRLYTSRDFARFSWNLAISSAYSCGLLRKKYGNSSML